MYIICIYISIRSTGFGDIFSHDPFLNPFLPKRSASSDQDGEVLSEQISTEGPGRPQSPWKMCVCVFFSKGNCDFKEKKYRFRLTL